MILQRDVITKRQFLKTIDTFGFHTGVVIPMVRINKQETKQSSGTSRNFNLIINVFTVKMHSLIYCFGFEGQGGRLMAGLKYYGYNKFLVPGFGLVGLFERGLI